MKGSLLSFEFKLWITSFCSLNSHNLSILYIFYTYSVLSHLSCRELYDVDFPSVIPFLVLNCLISYFILFFFTLFFAHFELDLFFCIEYFPWQNWNYVQSWPIKLWHFNTSQLHVHKMVRWDTSMPSRNFSFFFLWFLA